MEICRCRFKKWWKVEYDDGDAEDLNYRELATLQTPPDFQILKYASPAEMVRDFFKAAGGAPTLAIATNKGGSLEEFSLEGASWTLISVFNIKDSKCPLQGAYVLEDDFCYGMRDRDLKTLLSEFPGVRLSPMEDIRTWIDSYENAVVSKVGYFIIDLGLGLGLGRQREKRYSVPSFSFFKLSWLVR